MNSVHQPATKVNSNLAVPPKKVKLTCQGCGTRELWPVETTLADATRDCGVCNQHEHHDAYMDEFCPVCWSARFKAIIEGILLVILHWDKVHQ
jgi:hypothetical protein